MSYHDLTYKLGCNPGSVFIASRYHNASIIVPDVRTQLATSAAEWRGIERLCLAHRRYIPQLKLSIKEDASYVARLAYTLYSRRIVMQWKGFAVAESIADISTSGWQLSKAAIPNTSRRLGFVFAGKVPNGRRWVVSSTNTMSSNEVYSLPKNVLVY